jgi:hypothetical protein
MTAISTLELIMEEVGIPPRPLMGRVRIPTVLCCAFLICILPFVCAAQSKRHNPNRDVLPRVGTIKDYPATGLMTGCANLYFYAAGQARSSDSEYVFLARGDGSNAWMNLGGRDVRLQQVRSLSRQNQKTQRYYYRIGKLSITVAIDKFKPENEPIDEGDPMFKMTITLRQGRALRIIRAAGSSDC